LYGAAALAHPFGFAVAWLRVLAGGVAAVLRPRSAERLAVGFVQCTQIAYAAGIYLFLNAMIMGRPAYAFTHAFGRPTRPATEAVRELDRALRRRYEGFAPVVSGPWGYLAQDILARRSGYHVVDFHPDKVPAWEQRDVLLIVPAPGNPVLPWHDTPAVRGDGQAGFPGRVLLLERTERWLFYLVSPAAQASD
jgi:hypothetical protein